MWRCGLLCAAGVVSAGLWFPSPAKAELVVTISKADQRMSVTVDGSEMYRWPVSTGRGRYATPSGQWRPVRFERSWYSRKYDNAPMPFSIFFYRGYAVHGTTEVRHLGRAASHGCVRLHPDNAATLFSLARAQGIRGTRIVVTGLRLDGSVTPAEPRHYRHRHRYRDRSPSVQDRTVPYDRHAGFDAFGKAASNDGSKPSDAAPVETVSAKALPPLPPVKMAAVEETAPRNATPDKAAVAAPVAKLHVEPAVVREANVVVRGDRAPPEALRPGTHVVTMKVGSQAELRAIYRKYGFTW
ncbi:MAG: L,D-transpeptidase [Xanthobacteraceae bacterium]|uniref:L,D-transpeptidase n=1 Tax=Pseudolabrys sp. TaxID=1960880 RepID=UPI003D14E09D